MKAPNISLPRTTTRIFQPAFTILLACLLPANASSQAGSIPEAVELNSRLEIFADNFLIDRLSGDIENHLVQPEPQEVVLVTDQPWEGNTSAYYTLFQDDDRYRMYYRGSHFNEETGRATHPELTCYAESTDGIHWTKPSLGLFEFKGSKENNIVWAGPGTHNFTPFKDTNPVCPPESRYKALARADASKPDSGQQGQALYAFQSPDGIHWSLMQPDPVITEGAFDSQNLAFWDPNRHCYTEFHRTFRDGVRDIQTCTSTDFRNWTNPVFLLYQGAPREHLYTNAIMLYDRAPYLYIGFPTRYLPDEAQRVEPTFMVSRDGRSFHRWLEPVIPESAPEDRHGNRSNYMAWGLLRLPHNPDEYSVFGTEAYYTGPNSRLRRFTYRADGFTAIQGGPSGGQLLTRPFLFTGDQLVLNFRTSEDGFLKVGILRPDGTPIPQFSAASCFPLEGDHIAQPVTWNSNNSLASLADNVIRLRVHIHNAELFSLQFQSSKPRSQENEK